MKKIETYRNLISNIPVDFQSATVKKSNWSRFNSELVNNVFGKESEIEISRIDVKKESDIEKKIVLTLMWGYPSGGRGRHIQNILDNLDGLKKVFQRYREKRIDEGTADNLIKEFVTIKGLGVSTWSKLLYFFGYEIDFCKCQIYDEKIVASLNKKQFSIMNDKIWVHTSKEYYNYIRFLDDISKKFLNHESLDKIELFFFYFNLGYKFT